MWNRLEYLVNETPNLNFILCTTKHENPETMKNIDIAESTEHFWSRENGGKDGENGHWEGGGFVSPRVEGLRKSQGGPRKHKGLLDLASRFFFPIKLHN